MKRIGSIVVTLAALSLLAGGASAAPNKAVVPHFSLGASLPQSDALKDGWAIHGGATWFKADRPIGFRLDAGVDWWDADNAFLNTIDTEPPPLVLLGHKFHHVFWPTLRRPSNRVGA